ncbi:MAG: DUF4468 domain-containing protein [Chitinophagaceae bacterium]|nr:MAG: DUF4468 domain-containing protein [Chitinophagaceae bacterium]
MKKLYLPVLLFLTLAASAQDDTPVYYTGVVNIPGASKDSLFIKARQWLTETFTTARFYSYIEDKETGELTGRANTWLAVRQANIFNGRSIYFFTPMTYNIWVKDGRFKYLFTEFQMYIDSARETMPVTLVEGMEREDGVNIRPAAFRRMTRAMKESLAKQMELLIPSLERKMTKPASNDF